MLSGVRTGRKKRKRPAAAAASSASANLSAAADLRRILLAGGGGGERDDAAREKAAAGGGSKGGERSAWDDLERRGRIRVAAASNGDESGGDGRSGGDADAAVVLTGPAASASTLQREDLRRGARRGKLSKSEARARAEAAGRDATIEQMAAEERRLSPSAATMDEAYARNVARLGSRYRGSEFSRGSRSGADEEDFAGEPGGGDASMLSSRSDRWTDAERARRERGRQIAMHDRQASISARCWWWMDSPSFRRHMLLSLGDHVSLVLCPSAANLEEMQCILVPVRHAESFASCEDEVWDEVQRFRSSLRRMFAKRGKGVLFLETVLPDKKFHQARMEVVPVPRRVEQDAPIYFKSALTEQAEEWGTHTKILSTRGDRDGGEGLRRTVPKNFPYFNVEWDGGGYAQIIESAAFPRHFGLDTIAGMMGKDPMRFNRKRKAEDEDRGAVLAFCEAWKEFDWTLELDEGGAGLGGGGGTCAEK